MTFVGTRFQVDLFHSQNHPHQTDRFPDRTIDHHFMCVQCGLTRDFYSNKFDKLTLPESLQSIGYAEMTQVEVKGVCLKCAAKKKPS